MVAKSRTLNTIQLVSNVILVILEVLGFAFLISSPMDSTMAFSAESLKYYTILTALITLVASFLMIWANIVSVKKGQNVTPKFFFNLRMLSAVMNALTFLVVVLILRPAMLQQYNVDILFSVAGGSIFVHFLCPIISMLLFVIFEIEPKAKFKKTFWPFIATTLYAIVILVIMFAVKFTKGNEAAVNFAPYFFFYMTPDLVETAKALGRPTYEFAQNITVAVIVLVGSYLISLILWGLNRILSAIIVGVEYKSVTPSASSKTKTKTVKKVEEKKKSSFKSFIQDEFSFTKSPAQLDHVYHISYHNRKAKTWKVKSENAGRALKVFKTQKEAIDFANQQVKLHGGSIRIHSMVGKIRKEW